MQDVSGMFHKREIGVRNDTYTRAEIDAKDGAIQAAAEKAQETADGAVDVNNTQNTQISSLQKSAHAHSNKDVLDKTEQPYTTAERDKLAGLEGVPTTLWLDNVTDVYEPNCKGRIITAASICASRNSAMLPESTRQWAVLRIFDRDNGSLYWKADVKFYFGEDRAIGLENVVDFRKRSRFTLYAIQYSYVGFCTLKVAVCDAEAEEGVSSPRLSFSLEYVMPYGSMSLTALDSDSLSGNWVFMRCEDTSHKHDNLSILNQTSAAFTKEYKEKLDSIENYYTKPAAGIPKSDLASGVQASLGKADTALQKHQDISGKQDKLTAGANITISGNTISAKDTTYGNASASVAGLMSAEDKSKLDGLPGAGSISSLQFSNNESQTYMGVKFSGNRVSARFLVMENNGERADIYVSIRIGIDTKAKVYASGNTNTEYKMFYDTSNNVYVIFNCNAWSYGSCIASADNAAMSVWYGTSYPTGLTGITMDIQILLDTGNYANYALPKDGTAKKAELLSNGQIRTAYCHNDDATFSNGYVWFKIGTATLSGGYATVTTTFLAVCGYGKHALYTCRVRATSAGNAIESISFLESGRTGGMLTGLFRVAAINGSNGVSLELWAKGASRWEGTRIVILNEQNLAGGGQGNFWVLTSRGNADAKTAPTSGNMYVDSSDSSICANAANATKWSNLVADISTYNKKDTWLLVNNNGVIQHRLEGDLNVNSSKTLTDSGWVDCPLAVTGNTTYPASTSSVKVRKYGKLVRLEAFVKYTIAFGTGHNVAIIPEGYRPNQLQREHGVTASASKDIIFNATLLPSGSLSFSPAGGGSASTFNPATSYECRMTYFID